MTVAPMLPGRRDAPTMATDPGCSTCSAATAAVSSRSSKRRRPSSVRLVGKVTFELARLRANFDWESGVAESLDHLAVAGQHHGGEVAHIFSGRRLGELGEEEVAIPRPCQSSATANATSAPPVPSGKYWPCPTTCPSCGHGDEARALARVGEQVGHPAQVHGCAEETERARLVGELARSTRSARRRLRTPAAHGPWSHRGARCRIRRRRSACVHDCSVDAGP